MNIKTQITVAVVIVLSVIAIFILIRSKKVQIKYTLPWLLMALIILILDIFPGIVAAAAAFLGIGMPINMLFFFGLVLALFLSFILTITVSNLSQKLKRLTQEMGLLRKELEDLQYTNSSNKQDESGNRQNR